jgi:hypothetical protein
MKTTKKLTQEDKKNLKNPGNQHERLHTEGPLSEKDEVKAAEERTRAASSKVKK